MILSLIKEKNDITIAELANKLNKEISTPFEKIEVNKFIVSNNLSNKVNDTKEKIISVIRNNPNVTINQLVVITGLSEPGVKKEFETIKSCWNKCTNRCKLKWILEVTMSNLIYVGMDVHKYSFSLCCFDLNSGNYFGEI